ncbi:MAG: type II toxin-antitoxin system PemK/MazF family toxin [Deltaproteobacteria bacterium]|nr:type II toxin-antitoxin system PemK/MazF family toxin [Deltaproteobacteria bacterium]
MVISRFKVYLVRLDPTEGHEIREPRPCLIIPHGEMNWYIDTVVVAPLTIKGRVCPTRVPVRFQMPIGLSRGSWKVRSILRRAVITNAMSLYD